MIRRRVVIGVLLAVLFGVGWGVGRGRAGGDLYSNLDTFVEVLHAVQTSYVDPVEPRPLIEGGMRGMLRELDPYSEYLDEREYETLRTSLDEQFEGVGVLVDLHEGYPVVVAPIEGSPAWEAGLLPGDIITKVDGKSVLGLGLPEIGARVRGAAGSRVRVTVMRPGDSDDHDLVIERRHLVTPSVPYAFVMPNGIGYLRLSSFGVRAGEETAAALDSLRLAGARALVLDLRGNPGGLVEQAVAVVQQLVPQGSTIVYTQGRIASAAHKWIAGKSRPQMSWPMAVLVDRGSASAAEITAGALQDLDRALVMGSPTFGKGTVQDVYPLRNHEGALKLTTAYYYTASGRSLQRPPAKQADEDDAEDDTPDSTQAAPDSAPRKPAPVFHTAAGRVVHGGGGVEPDLAVAPDSLPEPARTIEARRVAFRFVAKSPAPGGDSWAAFREFVRAQGVTATDAELDSQRPRLERALERERARRLRGAAAAARLELADDAVYARAADVLGRAKTRRDVFAYAPTAAPARHATTPGRKGR